MNDEPEVRPAPSPPSVSGPAPSSGAPRPLLNTPSNGPGSLIQGGSVRLFRVAGIDVLLHWSWFFFALLDFQSSGANQSFGFARYQAQFWYVAEYLSLFGMVLLHEFGHVLACRSVGGIANRIILWPLGGVAFVDPPARPGALLWSIAAGPLVNAVLLAPTFGFYFLCLAVGWQDAAPDVCRFALALASINAYLLLFNLLPVFPLDGGRIVQALLWFVVGRARSLLAASVIGLLTTFGLLVFAIVAHSLTWGIMAGFGLLFSLVGVQSARALRRMLNAPRRETESCPACGAAPPMGNFWACPRCRVTFDAFASRGDCPSCGTPLASIFCPDCGRSRPYGDWRTERVAEPPLDEERTPAVAPAESEPGPPARVVRPATVGQRVLWGTIFAFFALALCGLPSIGQQPWGLIIWTAGGAVLGATSAGAMTRAWKNNQALRKLRGAWRLVEEDGLLVLEDEAEPRRLILNMPLFEERVGKRRDVRGMCWTDALTDPPAISFTPKTGPDAGKPRQGVYRLEGKSLIVCLAYPGLPRPTSLLAEADVQQIRVYRRGKGKAR